MKLYAVALIDRITGDMLNDPSLTTRERALAMAFQYKDDKAYKYTVLEINAEEISCLEINVEEIS